MSYLFVIDLQKGRITVTGSDLAQDVESLQRIADTTVGFIGGLKQEVANAKQAVADAQATLKGAQDSLASEQANEATLNQTIADLRNQLQASTQGLDAIHQRITGIGDELNAAQQDAAQPTGNEPPAPTGFPTENPTPTGGTDVPSSTPSDSSPSGGTPVPGSSTDSGSGNVPTPGSDGGTAAPGSDSGAPVDKNPPSL